MPSLSLMIKPSSSHCNLCCEYCFYHSLAKSRESFSYGFMSTETADILIKKALDYVGENPVFFAFQGGEPLLSGIDFFRHFILKVKEENKKNAKVFYGLQTNGTLINEEWCNFFGENNFLIGVSLDGTSETNCLRKDANGINCFEKTLNSIKLLNEYKVNYNILTVVTKNITENIEEIYNFYKDNNFKYLQFINYLSPFEEIPNDGYKPDIKSHYNYLMKLFSLYYNDFMKGKYVSIRQFDNYVNQINFSRSEQCGMEGHCSRQIVVEGDGTLFPCDFYCSDQWNLGNIKQTDFLELERNRKAIDFIKESIKTDDKCKNCSVYNFCRGGCKRYRADAVYCESTRQFLENALPFIHKMALLSGNSKKR